MTPAELIISIELGHFDDVLVDLYGEKSLHFQRKRYVEAVGEFIRIFGDNRDIHLFSAPGRTEIGGNHTDHQHGRAIAAAVNLDIICIASANDDGIIRVHSSGHKPAIVDTDDLPPRPGREAGGTALIRGIAAAFKQYGHNIGGFDCYATSVVLKGAGLSSSASFAVVIATTLDGLFNSGNISAPDIARTIQFAENVYWGKPSGLMDQMTSAMGGFVLIDFKDPNAPAVEVLDFDFSNTGYSLCIVDTGGSHSDMTPEYAAIPREMRQIAEALGKRYLRELPEDEFLAHIPELRRRCGDRAVLRAMHFYSEDRRAAQQAHALESGDFPLFLKLISESGRSSALCLQNIFPGSNPSEQGITLALSLSEQILGNTGAWRVHGGGFAGTIQVFVPDSRLDEYITRMEAVFGSCTCHLLSIRSHGALDLLSLKRK